MPRKNWQEKGYEIMENHETLWVKVYEGEGDDAKLIFEGTVRQWEIL